MPLIRFNKAYPSLQVDSGAPLMQTLLAAGLPVASSCNGDGICGRCRIEIIEGWENLSDIEMREQILSQRLRIKKPYRVSCQTKVFGDVTVDTSYW